MSFSRVWSAQTSLLEAHSIAIEVDLSKGLHAFTIVGLPDKAVEEARDRIGAAIKNAGFTSPKQKNQKVVIALAPADLKKEGPVFDLGMALAYLLACEEIAFEPEKRLFLGELSLQGELRPIRGTLRLVQEAKRQGFKEVYLPKANASEGALIPGITIYGAESLQEVIGHINTKALPGNTLIKEKKIRPQPHKKVRPKAVEHAIDFSDIKGQGSAKRGLEIAAAGGHNIAMWGPPGTGKTMLAKAFTSILPPLSFEDMLEITGIHSIAGTLQEDMMFLPPVRAPHHTASYVSLVGGGTFPKPGEITLAHKGVLFLDEFPEFDRKVLETLRQPLEERVISISRSKGSVQFPAHFILIAAMNPCPCGNYGNKDKQCICTPINLIRYQRKISGPIMDRIDMWVEVSQIDYKRLGEKTPDGENSSIIGKRVHQARIRQEERFKGTKRGVRTNSAMSAKDVGNFVPLNEHVQDILNASAARLNLSGRAYHRVIKLARTIADLEGSASVGESHILEALQYRPKQQVL